MGCNRVHMLYTNIVVSLLKGRTGHSYICTELLVSSESGSLLWNVQFPWHGLLRQGSRQAQNQFVAHRILHVATGDLL